MFAVLSDGPQGRKQSTNQNSGNMWNMGADWLLTQPITIQLYDEFVARGNVAVLKCLINMPVENDAVGSAKSTYQFSQYHTGQHMEFVQQNFLFEWKVKNGPAASNSARELITTLRSNQTQGN